MSRLDDLITVLEQSAAVSDKIGIRAAYEPALETVGGQVSIGDDCAAVPDGDGFLLFAAEGLLHGFVAEDPWFAGYSAVMVNISDVCAMGGRPTAVVDVLWSPDYERTNLVWEGMHSAAKAYGVPIVGGHTTLTRQSGGDVQLAAAILGRARKLMTSFDAQPGDDLIMVVDLNGAYRRDQPFWNASLGTPPTKLREDIELLPQIAEAGLCKVAKDISNGGLVGTLVMLLECSEVGAQVTLDAIPMPGGVPLEKWLLSFPSFGFLLSITPRHRETILGMFRHRDLACAAVGTVTAGPELELRLGGESRVFWRSQRGQSTTVPQVSDCSSQESN